MKTARISIAITTAFIFAVAPLAEPVALALSGFSTRAAADLTTVRRRVDPQGRSSRRLIRMNARERAADNRNSHFQYQEDYYLIPQQQKTLNNLNPSQRRARTLRKQQVDPNLRRASRLSRVTSHESRSYRQNLRTNYQPSQDRTLPGQSRFDPNDDPCAHRLGVGKARCYKSLYHKDDADREADEPVIID